MTIESVDMDSGDTAINNNHPGRITHVIFDLDGTLIDSEHYFYSTICDVLSTYGKEMEWELRSKTIGLFITKAVPIIIDHYRLDVTPDVFIGQVLARFKAYCSGEVDNIGLQLLPGSQQLLDYFVHHRIPMALCTASMKETYSYKIERFGDLFMPGKYFHHVVLGAADPDVHNNKPHPDPYSVSIERFSKKISDDDEQWSPVPVQPKNVLAFEDSPTGLASAVAAGCQSVFVQANPKIDPSQYNPTMVIDSLLNFKPEVFGLPPFDKSS